MSGDEKYYWANLGFSENRVAPLMRELIDAVHDEDPDKMHKIADRLKYLSGEIHSIAYRKQKKARGW